MERNEAEGNQRSSRSGGRSSEFELNEAALNQTLRYSNFLITISTNTVPVDEQEEEALTSWLLTNVSHLFEGFDSMNGTLIKPAGTGNRDHVAFPSNNKIINIRGRLSVEQGQEQHGQVHCHLLVECAHKYVNQEHGAEGTGNQTGKPYLGVHINVMAVREYLNARIAEMNLEPHRRPPKCYVNVKVLTTGTDNSNKWLTIQYINKDRAKDNNGGERDLRADEAAAPSNLSEVRENMLNYGHKLAVHAQPDTYDGYEGVGGALPREPEFVRTTVQAPTFTRTTVTAPSMHSVTSTANLNLAANRGRQPKRFQ